MFRPCESWIQTSMLSLLRTWNWMCATFFLVLAVRRDDLRLCVP